MYKFIVFIILFIGVSCSRSTSGGPPLRIVKKISTFQKECEIQKSSFFEKGCWPDENWWEFFEDKQLALFIETGLCENPSLKSAKARVIQANQEAYMVRSKLIPQINALFNIIGSYLNKGSLRELIPNQGNFLNIYTLAFDFNYEFDFWTKNWNQFKAALGEKNTFEAMEKQAELVISSAIAKQYFELQAHLAQLEVLEKIILSRTRLVELKQLRKMHRIDNELVINNIVQELITLQEAFIALKEEVVLEKSMLMTLMGLNPANDLRLDPVWQRDNKRVPVPEKIGLHLLERRPDLVAQVWRVQTACKKINVSIADFFPSVDLTAYAGLQNLDFTKLMTGNSLWWTILPVIKQPIFEGLRLRSQYKARIAEYEVSVHNYHELLLKAVNEVVSQITEVQAAEETLQFQDKDVLLAKSNYNLTYERYRHGIDSMMRVLTVDEKFLFSKIQQIQLENTRNQNVIGLIRSLGGGFYDPSIQKVATHAP